MSVGSVHSMVCLWRLGAVGEVVSYFALVWVPGTKVKWLGSHGKCFNPLSHHLHNPPEAFGIYSPTVIKLENSVSSPGYLEVLLIHIVLP